MAQEQEFTPMATEHAPGVCVSFEEMRAELPGIPGDEAVVKQIWEETDALGYVYIWQLLESF
jgi:hypothetical protein